MKKTAVILFNLGGPDAPEAVKPFLTNLFSDPAIIGLPWPLRQLVAKSIVRGRAPTAAEIYARIGGRSPIRENTEAQARALEAAAGAKCFISMRYWHPFAEETVAQVKKYAPDEIILLPLYPQFSTTTTASSFKAWDKAARAAGLDVPTKKICCYPEQPGFIEALRRPAQAAFEEAKKYGSPRYLFSAHGLPEIIIRRGDPYQLQCGRTAKLLAGALGAGDWVLCYQSRVGRLRWIGPSTEEEIRRAGRDKVPVVVVPLSFTSEHSETLFELDILCRELAALARVPHYARMPAAGTTPEFIAGLADLVRRAQQAQSFCASASGARLCPPGFAGCVTE